MIQDTTNVTQSWNNPKELEHPNYSLPLIDGPNSYDPTMRVVQRPQLPSDVCKVTIEMSQMNYYYDLK